MAEVIDYRVSRIVVLCKDCGHDVGLYPARHKCVLLGSDSIPVPPIPNLSTKNKNNNDGNASGLWGKLRSVNNWKNVSEDASIAPTISQPTQGSKLWDKLLSAAASYNSNNDDDSECESEAEGWEGETHISRILREYHQQKNGDIPDWLFDSNNKSNSDDDDINRGRKLGLPIVIDTNRVNTSSDRFANRNDQRKFPSSLPNNFDLNVVNDKTNNTLKPPAYQRAGADKSYSNSNRARSASPNPYNNNNFLASPRDADPLYNQRSGNLASPRGGDPLYNQRSGNLASPRDGDHLYNQRSGNLASPRDGDHLYNQRSGNYRQGRQGGYF
ncbi:18628_t:CDS:2 [Dentiscutata erythropus]|uniref:18628_t:CDS:1 n=1 Tax=Dentiscutata erythropus TaxID=1348616 RepID=A0A9N9BK13_9GLOM|nr:18628_t:CDS:2 [Dentiscutata erythropus]